MTDTSEEIIPLRRIKRRINLNKLMIIMIALVFVLLAIGFFTRMDLGHDPGTLQSNITYQVPAGYEENKGGSDEDTTYLIRDTDKSYEKIVIYYEGETGPRWKSSDETIEIDDETTLRMDVYDVRNDQYNDLTCELIHGKQNYSISYQCRIKGEEPYYSSCSKEQQEELIAFVRSFQYHESPDIEGNFFTLLYMNLGVGGLMLLCVVLLIFMGVPLAVAFAGLHAAVDEP